MSQSIETRSKDCENAQKLEELESENNQDLVNHLNKHRNEKETKTNTTAIQEKAKNEARKQGEHHSHSEDIKTCGMLLCLCM